MLHFFVLLNKISLISSGRFQVFVANRIRKGKRNTMDCKKNSFLTAFYRICLRSVQDGCLVSKGVKRQ